MVGKEEKILIAPCGTYCGSCPLYRAGTDQDLRKKIAERQGIPVEKISVCPGCRPSQGLVPVMGSEPCETYVCATGKKVEFCCDCTDFPCLKLAPCADRTQEIPNNTMIYNLLILRRIGADAWLEQYASLFKQYMRGKKPRAGGEIRL